MKRLKLLTIAVAVLALSACGPRIVTSLSKEYAPLDYREEVLVIPLDQPEPEQAEVLGKARIGDSGFTTNCSYETVVEKAKLEARKVGGNVIKIIDHDPPNLMTSSCHRITVKVLKVDNIEDYRRDEAMDSIIPNADYALLHIYRGSGLGALVGYDLHLGDSTICRVKNRWKKTMKIKTFGPTTLWAKTEAKEELPIDIKMGREYYIRCGLTMGAFVGHPKLELVDQVNGKIEYDVVSPRESNRMDLLVLKDGREVECLINSEDDENVYLTIFKGTRKVETQMSKDKIETIKRWDDEQTFILFPVLSHQSHPPGARPDFNQGGRQS